MRQLLILTLIIFSSLVFGQEKTYRFLYDFHQVYESNNLSQSNISSSVNEELNKSYEIEVYANKTQSFIHLIDVINNSQNQFFLNIKPEPNWLLVDNVSDLTYEKGNNVNQKFKYLQDSIQTFQLNLTGNQKVILGINAKEYNFETDDFSYNIWLGDKDGLSVSPIYYQFKNSVVLEAYIVSKSAIKNNGKREMNYRLKEIKEQDFNFKKILPKKFTTKSEYSKLLENISENNGVEKD